MVSYSGKIADRPQAQDFTASAPARMMAAPRPPRRSGEKLFRRRKLTADRGEHARIHRLDLGRERRGDAAVAADQVLVEVPVRRLERPLRGGPFVERMRVRALYRSLGGDREGDAVLLVRGLVDVVGAARLLAAEIVRRHAVDHEPSGAR